jgi:dipeptidyl aminopeptidase/acylaminoacyl peptidase
VPDADEAAVAGVEVAATISLPTAFPEQQASTAVPTPSPTATPDPTATATAPSTTILTATPTPSPSATSTPDPYAAYSIEALAERDYGGGEVEIVERLEMNDSFARYLIRYPSDGLTVYGFMNVPHDGWNFPVAIVLHGYVSPASYETLDYTTRYADVLAEAGYFVIHPNLRGFPPSDEGEDAYRTGLAADVLNLIAIIREQSSDLEGPLRRTDPEAIHLWGHSMGGGAALRVATVLNEPYLRAVVLYGAMSGDERQNYEQIMIWSDGGSGQFELAASEEALRAISPIYHLDRISAPLSIHHGDGDETVPPEWSADLCAKLEAIDHPVECFTYNAAPHTFYGDWEELFNRRVVEFFERN